MLRKLAILSANKQNINLFSKYNCCGRLEFQRCCSNLSLDEAYVATKLKCNCKLFKLYILNLLLVVVLVEYHDECWINYGVVFSI